MTNPSNAATVAEELEVVPPAGSGRGIAAYQAWVIALLSLLYVISLVDRTVPSIIIGPLKAEFDLTDIHIGLLLGTVFGIVYSLLGLPAARLVDTGNRTNLIFWGVMLWCAATVGSAFSTSFAMLLVMRLGLAAGESILAPAAHSMIGDLVHPDKRSLAASIYHSAGTVGPPIAFFGGGIMLGLVDGPNHLFAGLGLDGWQIILILVGAPGIALGLLFYLTVREPARMNPGQSHANAPLSTVFRQLAANRRLYVGLLLAAAFPAVVNYAFVYWSVELLERRLGWTTTEAGMAFGTLYLVGGVGGNLLAPWLSRRLKAARRPDYAVASCLVFAVLGVVGAVLAPLQYSWVPMIILLCLCVMGGSGVTGNIVVAMQEVAPANMRGTFVATLFLIMSLFGLGLGPAAAPTIGAFLFAGGDGLAYGLAICGAVCMVASTIALFYIRKAFIEEAARGFPAVMP